MAKMKPGQVSAKSVYKISNSLMDKSNLKKKIGDNIVKSAKDEIKRTNLVSKMGSSFLGSKYASEVNDKLKNSGSFLQNAINDKNKLYKGAKKDSLKSVNLKSRADKAMAQAGRDMPLPSSEGIIGKIKNFFD